MSSGAPVSDQWFYVLEDRQIGPVGKDQLIRLVERGIVQADTFVWREGLQDWVEARRVKFLPFQVASAVPPVKVAVAAVVDQNDSDEEEDEEEEEDPRPRKKKKKRRMEYASIWQRFVGMFVDGLVISFINMFVMLFLTFTLRSSDIDLEANETMIGVVLYLAWFVIYVLYFSILESSETQASLGKMAIGVKVVDQDGKRISYPQSLGRAVGRFFGNIFCGIGFLVAAFTEKKQGLHDLMAGTLVIKS